VSEAGYIGLFRSGELKRRADELEARLSSCDICPRECGDDRCAGESGFCGAGFLPAVASDCAHHGEEPAISGSAGSGTVFFAGCNLRCVYCQNHQISQGAAGPSPHEIDAVALAGRMMRLQDQGCHNINFVSPSHFVPQIVRAVLEAVPMGLRVPLVYNTSSYDSVRTLEALDGVIDIYLADLRYASNEAARRFSGAGDYVERARAAIREMHRQVGDLSVDASEVAVRGLLVRHLVLPEDLAGSRESLGWLAQEVSRETTVSIMSQYYPAHQARRFPQLARGITVSEYQEVLSVLDEMALENGWAQGMGSAESYRPDFAREGHPFSPPAGPR
jgi:putative pyruvate formate lyase activating enzyme